MAREVQIMTWCDHCLAADNENVAGSERVGINSAGVQVVIDLCDDCAEAFIQPALSTFDAYGRTEPKKRKSRKVTPSVVDGVPCDQPGCDRVLNSLQALGMHKYRSHGIASPHRKTKSA